MPTEANNATADAPNNMCLIAPNNCVVAPSAPHSNMVVAPATTVYSKILNDIIARHLREPLDYVTICNSSKIRASEASNAEDSALIDIPLNNNASSSDEVAPITSSDDVQSSLLNTLSALFSDKPRKCRKRRHFKLKHLLRREQWQETRDKIGRRPLAKAVYKSFIIAVFALLGPKSNTH